MSEQESKPSTPPEAKPEAKSDAAPEETPSPPPESPAPEAPKAAKSDATPAAESTDAPAKTPATTPPATTKVPKLKANTATPPDGHWWWGTGRRKAAVARVRIRAGNGKFMVNKRELKEYFTEDRDHKDIYNVLKKTGAEGGIDVHVNTHGGGYTGQAGAIVLGLGRALLKYDQSLEPILRDNNFLSRDPRRVERKKYGQPGARKRFQFSKR